jgi:hypothetical protein
LPLPQIEHRASSTPSLYRVTYPGSFNMWIGRPVTQLLSE